ncbi:CusA/CzcA family heavy metal efflux RND transporter [Endozoicomonas sp. 8E]|uniref:efflux RND transporter permease subunit n=1 Tax=Endozoicomonas sp. 8E TaxID=3035692 RepID=UPI002938F05A|nr:CusA/CzcA family heavy metal efflux RND transporter [Endozoicomonas sp. 8E]WOG28315.1 CusA/CzcA family heavy metal efflux RND transporter [Endozoicomonas sp. 8E]
MITAIIRWSLGNRFLVLLAALALLFAGVWITKKTPVDALPDLSDVQVIIKTDYPGQAPQVVEDQVTYPLTTAMMAVPGAVDVRGVSMFGTSYVYILFEDGTDMYWARSRVLEYLNQVQSSLPDSAKTALGPDATGVGWVFNYALVDRGGDHDLAQLTSLQNWYLKFQLQSVPGVSEVATVGGMVRQYQAVADPDKLRAYGISLRELGRALQEGNSESGASAIEMAEAEYMVRVSGYLDSLKDIRQLPLKITPEGTPLTVGDVADVRTGPQMRRGIAELNGEGEVVGGIIVMRYGENAREVIEGVKNRLQELASGLPEGVEIITTYDRSTLVDESVRTLNSTLMTQLIIVVAICALFLLHFRSSLVIVISLPLGILGAFVIMYLQGLNANIMSLGGIAVAIGSMVDGAIVMIENFHKHMQRVRVTAANRWQVVRQSSIEVGPPLFFSLLIEAISFMPVFSLQAQEGRMFSPLAFTKSYAMVVAAGLTITLVPVLIGYLVRGKIMSEDKNPVNKGLMAAYRPLIHFALKHPKALVAGAIVLMVVGTLPASKLGSEFMPPLDEGDLMYMPTTYAGISTGKARELLQQTDRLIKTVPEVETVFGKAGRAETATDPAPLTMIETIVQLKPRSEWREGLTPEQLKTELEERVKLPGVSNAWVMPIKTRIDMLSTGIKTPVGIQVTGPDLDTIEDIGKALEQLLTPVAGTLSVYAERVAGGRYIRVDIDRIRAARYGLSISTIQSVTSSAIGGMDITQAVEGVERYPVNLRYPQHYRNSVEKLKVLPVVTPSGQTIALGDVANIYVEEGPAAVQSENARPTGRVLVDIADRDLGSYVEEAKNLVAANLDLPAGYALEWTGQYEYMERASERLGVIIPATLLFITVVLFLTFRSTFEVVTILGTLPFALIGGIWLMYLQDYNLSVAVGVGFIALAGVTVGNAIMMLVYLNQSLAEFNRSGRSLSAQEIKQAVLDGAVLRLRPIMMTVCTILFGLIPAMLNNGTGSEVMQRIAGPMIGGIVSSLAVTLVLVPAVYFLWHSREKALTNQINQ